MSIIAFTGHRPMDLCGSWDHDHPSRKKLRSVLNLLLRVERPRGVISGLAQGVDSDAVIACINLGIPYVGVAPCRGQESPWPKEAQRRYWHYAANADGDLAHELYPRLMHDNTCPGLVYVHPDRYRGPWQLHNRNHAMVDQADILVAVWNGKRSGGTYQCLTYAMGQRRAEGAKLSRTIRIDPKTLDAHILSGNHRLGAHEGRFVEDCPQCKMEAQSELPFE